MKKLFLLLLLGSLAGNFNQSFSWDSTAAKFYPLAIGNKWVYEFYYTQFGNTYFGGYRVYRTVTDTLIAGHRYYRVLPFACNNQIYERIDSNSMNVYRWNGTNSDILIDSLLVRKSNTFRGYRNCSNTNNIPVICQDTISENIFGVSRRTKRFLADGLVALFYKLAENLGVVYYQTVEGGSSWNILKGCVINGILYGDTSTTVGINQIGSEIPGDFSLSQNYPNPFNPITNIEFQIPKTGFVKLIVFDALGQEVVTLVNEELQPGTYKADFDGANLPSGVYYYKLEADSYIETKKMVLIK